MSDDPIYKNFVNVLKDAKMGEVKTRFPPEPSGYMHVGHVKASMLNYHYAKMYKGKMVLRFDDTNPMNEKVEFVENITKDLKTLEIIPDEVSHTSDYFEELRKTMEDMINKGKAYADNSKGEEMKAQRDDDFDSPNRGATAKVNMKIFKHLLAGDKEADGWCIRAKVDKDFKFKEGKKDLNVWDYKCCRDPVFYRGKKDIPHHKTGDKYKAYPCYDFACPVVDSIEGITHALRSIEYHDRNGGY